MLNFIIPEALSAPIGNIATQLVDGDGSGAAVYVNSITGLGLGFLELRDNNPIFDESKRIGAAAQ